MKSSDENLFVYNLPVQWTLAAVPGKAFVPTEQMSLEQK